MKIKNNVILPKKINRWIEENYHSYQISSIIEIPNGIIVLLTPPKGHNDTRNVIALSAEGKLLWKIEQSVLPTRNQKYPYSGLGQDSEGPWAFNFNGMTEYFDLNNGKIIKSEITK